MKIKIVNPSVADGTEVMISGLGTYQVGETVDITDQQAQRFREVQGHNITDSTAIEVVTEGNDEEAPKSNQAPSSENVNTDPGPVDKE